MKFNLLLFIFIAGLSLGKAQNNSDAIVGKWLDHTKKTTVEIYESDGKYYGKVIGLKEPNDKCGKPRKDKKNTNSKLRNREVFGLEVLSELEFFNGKWTNGEIYSIDRGRLTSCSANLENDKVLNIDIKTRFFTKTIVWNRL